MDSDAPSLDDLVFELRAKIRRLHRLQGEPSTRAIARRTGGAITHTTVHSVLRCLRLPRWGPLELVIEALGGEREEFRARWVAIRDAMDVVDAGRAPIVRPSRSPSADPDGSGVKDDRDPEPDLVDRTAAVVAGLLKMSPDELRVDSDGDICIRSGTAMIFVRVRQDPPLIDVFSPLITDVTPTSELYVRLSHFTNRLPIGRIYCVESTVWASIPVFGRNFQDVHLMLAIQVMNGLADELDDILHDEFGGRRFFGDSG